MAREQRVGHSRKSLVLETADYIRILRGDKYYTLNFDESRVEDKDGNPVESNFIICDTIIDYENGTLEYPGDEKIIFARYSGIFYTLNNSYYPFALTDNSDSASETTDITFKQTVNFEGLPGFTIIDNRVIQNLNADMLDGYHADDFVLKSEYDKNKRQENNSSISDSSENDEASNLVLIGLDAEFNVKEEFYDAKTGALTNIRWLEIIKDEYDNDNLDVSESYLDLIKKLFTQVNNNWNFTVPDDTLLDSVISNENLLFEPKDEETWKTINTKDGISLYEKYLLNLYEEDLSEYNGATYVLTVNKASTLYPGIKLSGVQYKYEENTNVDSENENLSTTDMIIVGVDITTNEVYVKTNVQSYNWLYAKAVSKDLVFGDNQLTIQATVYEDNEVEDSEDKSPALYYELEEVNKIKDVVGYIGNYKGAVSDIFWLKLKYDGGFIGLTKDTREPFMVIEPDGTTSIPYLESLITQAGNETNNKIENLEEILNSLKNTVEPVISFDVNTDETGPVNMLKSSRVLSNPTKVDSNWWAQTYNNVWKCNLSIEVDPNTSLSATAHLNTQINNMRDSGAIISCGLVKTNMASSVYELWVCTMIPGEHPSDMAKKGNFHVAITLNKF